MSFSTQVQLPDWTKTNALFDNDTIQQDHALTVARQNNALASAYLPDQAAQQLAEGAEKLKASQLANQFTQAAQPGKINMMNQLLGGAPPPAAAIIQVPLSSNTGGPASVNQITDALGASEGGNNPAVVNKQGFNGQYQFGAPRLADLGVYHPADGEIGSGGKWNGQTNGTFAIPGFPDVKTKADFLANPEAQRAVMHAQVADLQGRIAGIPGADKLDPVGLVAVGHLGGPTGMRRFVETGGEYNPADANGTRLSDYYTKFSGNPSALQAAAGHPDGPLDPAHPGMAPYQVASNAPVAPPAAAGVPQGMQQVQMDDTARASVRELALMQKLAIANGDMRSAAQLEARKEAIAGPGGIITPTGDVYIVPGAMATRAAASNATETGKIAPMAQIATNKAEIDRQTHYVNSGVDTVAAAERARAATAEKMNEPHFVAPGTKMVTPSQVVQPTAPQGALQSTPTSTMPTSPGDQRGVVTIGKDEIPPAILKLEETDVGDIQNSSSINADLGALSDQLKNGQLTLGPLQNRLSDLRNATGNSSENSRNYNSFQTKLKGIINDSLRLNKGVQTEGDAQRAAAALLDNTSDQALVVKRLGELQAVNQRGAQYRVAEIQRRRSENGISPMDTSKMTNQPATVGLGTPKGSDIPFPVKTAADYQTLKPGALYTDPDGHTRKKPGG